MKAAVVIKPGVLEVQDVPAPIPGEYDALCEILYGATCTGTDLHLIDGVFPWPPAYPAILGHESVGRVVEVGRGVRNFQVGDLVTRVGSPPLPQANLDVCWGGFSEFGIAGDHWEMRRAGLPPEKWSGNRVNQVVPPGIDPRAATMIITWRETFSYLMRMGLGNGASLLVVGSGGNGLSFLAHAANLGAAPIAMAGSPARKGSPSGQAPATFSIIASLIGPPRPPVCALVDSISSSTPWAGRLPPRLPWVRCAVGVASGSTAWTTSARLCSILSKPAAPSAGNPTSTMRPKPTGASSISSSLASWTPACGWTSNTPFPWLVSAKPMPRCAARKRLKY